MKRIDREALELSMAIARREPGRSEQLDSMLKGKKVLGRWVCTPQSWAEVAEFASHCCQMTSLGLMPWENSPSNRNPDGDRPHDVLLRKMLAAGVSRFHPDPAAALEAL